MLTRREIIAAGIVAAVPAVGAPRYALDWQGGPQTPEIAAALAAQIALVEALQIDRAILDFFAAQPIAVDVMPGSMSRIGPHGVIFERRAVPADNPILLHELLHLYHLLRLPGGYANAEIAAFYEAARHGGLYPPTAYMLSDRIEFFAMTASTVLYGRQPRPPFTRAEVATKSPDLYRWITNGFGLRV